MFLHKNSVWKVLQSDASRAEHLGSSTANGFSATLASGSIRRVCVTAFQLVHFQIAYHSSWWSYITQSYEMGLPLMVTFQYSNRKELKTADSSGLQQHIVWQCEGCSTRFVVICSSSDADNWKCAPLVLCIGHLRFCFLFDLAIHYF